MEKKYYVWKREAIYFPDSFRKAWSHDVSLPKKPNKLFEPSFPRNTGLNESGPINSRIWTLGFQLVDCLGRFRSRGLIGGGASLKVGIKVSKVHRRTLFLPPSLTLPAACGPTLKLKASPQLNVVTLHSNRMVAKTNRKHAKVSFYCVWFLVFVSPLPSLLCLNTDVWTWCPHCEASLWFASNNLKAKSDGVWNRKKGKGGNALMGHWPMWKICLELMVYKIVNFSALWWVSITSNTYKPSYSKVKWKS